MRAISDAQRPPLGPARRRLRLVHVARRRRRGHGRIGIAIIGRRRARHDLRPPRRPSPQYAVVQQQIDARPNLQSRERGGLWRQELATGKEEPVLPDYRNRNFRVLADGIYLLDVGATPGNQNATLRPGAARFYRFATKTVETLGFATPRPVIANGIDLSRDRKWVYFSMFDAAASDLQLIENLPFRGDPD